MTIVYVVGVQNSGSTMLEALLGAAPGARGLGEVIGFDRYHDHPLCQCGEPAAGCGPCVAVRATIDRSPGADAFRSRWPAPRKERRLHWLLWSTAASRAYVATSDDLYDSVALSTGATVLIDSSKNVSRAGVLCRSSRHDVRFVHLVRDGRSYLASRRRRQQTRGTPYRRPIAMGGWLAKNLLAASVLRRQAGDRYLRLRYEDLTADPEASLDRLAAFAGLAVDGIADAALGEGVTREHLFEPPRATDYTVVRLDRSRSAVPSLSPVQNWIYWLTGGFASRAWGYRR